MSIDTIMYVFAGRRPNMELQMPFIYRILDEHPNVEFHVWNLSHTMHDSLFLRTIEGDRITVINDYSNIPHARFNAVYRHYCDPKFSGYKFVKLDDDVVFIESGRFGDFLTAIADDVILSAKVVNNGACTPTEPGLWRGFEMLGIPLLDVHKHFPYAYVSHNYFFDHWPDMVEQPIELISTQDWLSINMIGYTWATGCRFAPLLRTPSPPHIAGRDFAPHQRLGDEGVANMFNRQIFQGMTACHLYFGPQLEQAGEEPFVKMRQRYAEIGQKYLSC